MVGLLFVYNPNPSEYNVINHIDGNKINNNYSNLEWTTICKNNQHAWEIGLCKPTFEINEETIRKIRSEYIEKIETTYNDLAIKYSINKKYIKDIIRYKNRTLVDKELKNDYFLLVNEKRNIIKNKEIQTNLKKEINILQDYVNGIQKFELIKKYKICYKNLKNLITNKQLPDINKLNGEIFKSYNQYEISNLGRIQFNGVIINKSDKFIIKALAKTFIPNPNNYKTVHLIDESKPISIHNLEWYGKTITLEMFESLKEKYKTEEITIKDFKIKYKVSDSIMLRLRKEIPKNQRPNYSNFINYPKKEHLCNSCGENNPLMFPKKSKGKCKKCCNTYIKKPKREHLCKTCGENNPINFSGGSKGECNSCKNKNRQIKKNVR
jgi:hypothetical protein